MKYSVYAQNSAGGDISVGYVSAAAALANVIALKGQGADHIQIIDVRTGRLIDEAALARAEIQDGQFERMRRGGAPR